MLNQRSRPLSRCSHADPDSGPTSFLCSYLENSWNFSNLLDLIYFTWYNYMQYSECRTMFSLSLRKAVRCALCGAAQKHSRSYSITTFCSYPTGFREKCNPPGRASVLAVCMPVPGILMISCGKSSGVLAKGKEFALHSTADLFPFRGSNCLRTPSFGSILRHRRWSLCSFPRPAFRSGVCAGTVQLCVPVRAYRARFSPSDRIYPAMQNA